MSDWIRPIGASLLPHVGGVLGGLLTRKEIPTWYKDLKKPPWTPPNWVFAPVWTTLYTGMGYASYLVWKEGGGFDGDAKLPLALYGTQLALNWIWTPIFFKYHQLGLAGIEIIGLWGAIAGCVYTFYPVSPKASYLMMPYLAWATLATSINLYVWKYNPSQKKD